MRWGSYFNDYWYSLKSNLVEFPLHIIIVYINIYYLVPKFIIRRKYKTYIFFLLLSLAVHYLIRSGLNYWLVTEDIWPEAEGLHEAFGFNHIIAVTLGELYVVGLVSAIKFTIDFVIERNKNNQLLKLQYETELKYLKAQIQPHFFFNTLNNLYALTMQRSEKAPEVVLKLSEIMQYVIYDVNKKKISLLKEINYIHNYIELEKLRRGNMVESDMNIAGDIDDVKVPPLLFLPFIENCFKHGLKNGEKIFVKINFKKHGDQLDFKLKNNFNPDYTAKTKNGIGIINTKRRLELLYDNRFELETYPVEDQYRVILKIPVK
ncbi:sensor histidine kinase [Leptobacterium flavescens]|uniref:sensor histidine kinase n=1 Tax=Leptobacterium flavescens TaxID=472055 RepID=UPI00293BE2C0|nr:histidine kinase [Leptobacterium flavescens]